MLTPLGSYDTDLQMFAVRTNTNSRHLRWMRWLADQGLLEHLVAGPSSGPYVEEVFTSSERTS